MVVLSLLRKPSRMRLNSGHFHHRCVPAFIYKMQFAVWDQPVEFLSNKRRGDGIVISPYQAGGLFDLA